MALRTRSRSHITELDIGKLDFGPERLSGPPLAAVLAAAIGSFVLGAMTTLAEAFAGMKSWLEFVGTVGPLSGKTTMAVTAWAASWLVFGLAWRRREINVRLVVIAAATLIGLGLIGTFPSFFETFATE
ncbi:MAG TPA: hypothetical protein VFA34_01635 [Actinomycetota bacterium]|jgi:hypothetical protein|nr:hypothetical protein [Actinomycetota bacterium]